MNVGDTVYLVDQAGKDFVIVTGTVTVARPWNANVRVAGRVIKSVPVGEVYATRVDAESGRMGRLLERTAGDARRADALAHSAEDALKSAQMRLDRCVAEHAKAVDCANSAAADYRSALAASAARMFGKGVTLAEATEAKPGDELVYVGQRGMLERTPHVLGYGKTYRVVRP